MFKNYLDKDTKRGFIALTALVLLATGTLAFALTTLSSAVSYGDLVYRRESRIQARFNNEACLDMATLMVVKDFFLNGEVSLAKFECHVSIFRDYNKDLIILSATTSIANVCEYGRREFYLK